MEKLIKIIRISSKEWFKELKLKNPIFCNAIWKEFLITNIFYQHILWYKKSRPTRETIERLSLINLVEKIALEWKLSETRENWTFEDMVFDNTFRIVLRIWSIKFNLVLWEQKSSKIILLSCFVKDYRNFEA